MAKIFLYIATSLDGYIADINGNIDWLTKFNFNNEIQIFYDKFYSNISTVIMGNKTYQQIINELSPNFWPYEEKDTFVFTTNITKNNNKNNIFFLNKDIIKEVNKIKQNSKKDIWVVGGSEIVNFLLKENLIDEIIITIIPTLLGNGIPLFKSNNKNLILTNCNNMGDNIVMLQYKVEK